MYARPRFALSAVALVGLATKLFAATETLRLNDLDYFEARGVNVMVFSNWYNGLFSDSKMSGIELVHHGVRTATNGDVRLNATPEQWDPIPEFVERKVDRAGAAIEAFLRYPDYDFDYSIRAELAGEVLTISVNMPRPLPAALEGRAGFNLEFLPAAYFEKSWSMDDDPGLFPLYPTGPGERNDRVAPVPMASGHTLVLAPDTPDRQVTITSNTRELHLYDGRAKAQNGWFVVRSLLPAGKSGRVLEWTLAANSVSDWVRTPVIAHSQVGYHPRQDKRAVIELDGNARTVEPVALYKVGDNGKPQQVLQEEPRSFGPYKRYRYYVFDFSKISDEGIYYLQYGVQKTAPFPIATDVYDKVWHPTLDVYFPVQMDHVLVNEAYRVWHGASHLDDARQAPVDHDHFDLYAQGPTTDTPYQPGEHIPGLNVGGWYDAGDYDIRTQTQYSVVNNLVNVWENFAIDRDTTTVDYARHLVDIHVPDGKPDLLQQIEHGTLALVAQYRAVGHAIAGIIVPTLAQYTHLGDGLTMTDNLVYDPGMSELESDGKHSGMADDRWAFTSRSSALNFGSIAALAAASRALRGYNDELADECLKIAVRVWDEEQSHEPDLFRHGNTTGGPLAAEELKAALELLVTTGERKYGERFLSHLPEIEDRFAMHAVLAVRALPFLDDAYRGRIAQLTRAYRRQLDDLGGQNPFGVLITEGGWAGNGTIIGIAMANYYLHRAFPDIIGAEDVYSGLNYIFGTHPDSDISFVSAVGARSKKVAYGMNRADYSFIAGGIVPGVLVLAPDLPENKEDWPFLWGENEYVISLGASYLFLANAVNQLLQGAPSDDAGTRTARD
jgi:endoglucanase